MIGLIRDIRKIYLVKYNLSRKICSDFKIDGSDKRCDLLYSYCVWGSLKLLINEHKKSRGLSRKSIIIIFFFCETIEVSPIFLCIRLLRVLGCIDM